MLDIVVSVGTKIRIKTGTCRGKYKEDLVCTLVEKVSACSRPSDGVVKRAYPGKDHKKINLRSSYDRFALEDANGGIHLIPLSKRNLTFLEVVP